MSQRVTFVLPGYPRQPVGGYRVVYEYANRLVAKGHKVSVVHARRCGASRGERVPAPFSPRQALGRALIRGKDLVHRAAIDWHSIDPRVKISYTPSLDARHIPDGDVVVATAWRTARPVMGYGPEKGRKFYLIQHHETWDGRREAVDATWLLPMRKIVIARWLERLGIELGVEPSSMRYIPNGIDERVYRLIRPIAGRPKRVAALCHDLEWKGSRDAIAALDMVRSADSAVEMVMFGVMQRPAWVPSWIDYRHDPSQQELVEDIYNGSSIYLCASWSEGWHLPPPEAMACGCAVVSTDIDGVADYIIPDKTGLLGQPRQPETLAGHLLTLLEDDDRRVAVAEEGNRLIQTFNWDSAADALAEWFLAPDTITAQEAES